MEQACTIIDFPLGAFNGDAEQISHFCAIGLRHERLMAQPAGRASPPHSWAVAGIDDQSGSLLSIDRIVVWLLTQNVVVEPSLDDLPRRLLAQGRDVRDNHPPCRAIVGFCRACV